MSFSLLKLTKKRLFILLSIFVITPIGFYSKFYSGNGELWINNHLGGTFYVIFWCLVFYFIFPECKPFVIAGWVLAVTVMLEFLQLYHPKFLELLRGSFIGKTILGTSFNWIDFIYDIIGFVIAVIWLKGLNNLKKLNYFNFNEYKKNNRNNTSSCWFKRNS